MEAEKERMLALISQLTTPVDPSGVPASTLGSPTASLINSSNNVHSASRINSAINSTNNISAFNSINNLNSCLSSTHTVNMPYLHSNLHLNHMGGSSAPSANVTPLPVKKFWYPESDAGTDLLNVCRICQLPGDDQDFLFSPCRCSGSLRYVHYTCLLKWIDISTRKTKKPPRCELCHFSYIRHKRFKFSNWRLPRVSRQDKCLHAVFLLTVIVMVACAVATVLCFLSDNGKAPDTKSQLSVEEVVTLTCGIMFFVSFFLAMTVEIRARHSVYRLFWKFITHNTEWKIEPYDKAKDSEYPVKQKLPLSPV